MPIDEARTSRGGGLLAFVVLACATLVGCKRSAQSDALGDVEHISGGGELTCAHQKDTTTWCWGDDALTAQFAERKHARKAVVQHVTSVVRPSLQTCVVLADRTVACSDGEFGLLGPDWKTKPELTIPGETGALPRHLLLVPDITDAIQLAAGTYIYCARRVDGVVLCWGDYAEVLQTGAFDRTRPSVVRRIGQWKVVEVKGLPSIVDISAGDDGALAIGNDGSVWTVGGRGRGIERVPGIDDGIAGGSGVGFHCVLRRTGDVSCFRYGAGIDSLKSLERGKLWPVKGVVRAKALASGQWESCAILDNGTVSCWGLYDAMMKEHSTDWLAAQPVAHADHVKQLMVGNLHACGLRDDGRVFCWGDGRYTGTGYEFEERSGKKPEHLDGYVRVGPDPKK